MAMASVFAPRWRQLGFVLAIILCIAMSMSYSSLRSTTYTQAWRPGAAPARAAAAPGGAAAGLPASAPEAAQAASTGVAPPPEQVAATGGGPSEQDRPGPPPAATPGAAAELGRIDARVKAVAGRRAGLYADKGAHPEFASILLLTAANLAYLEIYSNWRCFADRLSLDWAVVANEDGMEDKVGADRALLVGNQVNYSQMVGWGSAKLDVVGRNKMVTVLKVMSLTGLDVLFTDADNVFRGDPFRPGASLGDLLRSGRYDYVYQEELQKAPSPDHRVPGDGGNTGFFFVSGTRKPQSVRAFWATVLSELDRIQAGNAEHLGADQSIFWQVLNALRQSRGASPRAPGGPGFRCFELCGQPPSCEASAQETLQYCSMDPFQHPTGWEDPPGALVTYHANYASNEMKIDKLKRARLWGASCAEPLQGER